MPFDPNVRLDAYYKEIEVLEAEFVKNIQKLVSKPNLSQLDLSQFLTQYDFFTMLKDMGYQGKATAFMNDWNAQILQLLNLSNIKQAELVAQVDITSLETVRRLELDKLLRRGQDYAGDVRAELLKSLMNGSDILTIQQEVLPKIQREMVFYPSWFNAMVNTAYSEYNATGLKMLTEPYPDVRFILRGPLDPHTRPACKHALTIMKDYPEGLTAMQIDEQAILGTYKFKNKNGVTGQKIYTMKDRGGHNCRHFFEAVSGSFPEED